jgi:tetratricopeptide (TPR) repeat protein
MKSVCLPLILASAVGLSSAHAANPVNFEGWYQCSNSDFSIVSQMSPSDTAAWAGRLSQFMQAMKGVLPGDPRALGPSTLVLFGSQSELYDAAPLRDNGSPSLHLGGFWRTGGWGAIGATCEKGSTENTQRMVYESCVDWLLSADHRHRPRALSAGISEVYGAYVIENGTEIFGRPVRGWISRLQRAVDHPIDFNERFLRLEDLLAVKDLNEVADRHAEPMFNVEAWGFAHFLLFSKDMAREHGMDRLLEAFSHNLAPHDALVRAFGEGAETLNSRFRNYVTGGDFYEYAAPIVAAAPVTPPSPAAPALVASTLSRLESAAKRYKDARSYAEHAIQLAPNDAPAHAALTLVDFMEQHTANAQAGARETLRMDPNDGPTWLIASLLVGRTNAEIPATLTPDQAREAMNDAENAILKSRGMEAAYARVAALIPAVGGVTDDDGRILILGRELFPNDAWIEIGHAQWAHRVHADALGLKIITDVLSRSDLTPEALQRAQALKSQWASGPT